MSFYPRTPGIVIDPKNFIASLDAIFPLDEQKYMADENYAKEVDQQLALGAVYIVSDENFTFSHCERINTYWGELYVCLSTQGTHTGIKHSMRGKITKINGNPEGLLKCIIS